MLQELRSYQQDGRGLYYTTPNQIKDYILTNFTKEAINLNNVDNTSDLNKPVSKFQQAALDSKVSKTDFYVRTLNGSFGDIAINAETLGLGLVDNTKDVDKPVSTAQAEALATKVDSTSFTTFRNSVNTSLASKVNISSANVANGYPTLDNDKVLSTTVIPPLTSAKVLSSQVALKLQNPVEISLKGAASGSVSIDGATPKVDLNLTLNDSGAKEGVYGSSSSIPTLTLNSKGLITNIKVDTIPISSLTSRGLVQLNSSTTSSLETTAATSLAVKKAYDLAAEAKANSLPVISRGAVGGVASLDETGKVPSSQLPAAGLTIAGRLNAARKFTYEGDVQGSVSFDGSTDVTGQLTLKSKFDSTNTVGSSTSIPVLLIERTGIVAGIGQVPLEFDYSALKNKPSSISGTSIKDVYTKQEVNDLISNAIASAIPAGLIAYFPSTSIPNGWLPCRGGNYSRTTYARLFSAIGTTYGAGNGTTTFAVPDCRAKFIRCLDDSFGRDIARVIGSIQEDMFKAHTHTVKEGSVHPTKVTGEEQISSGDDWTQVVGNTSTTTSTGGTETRPYNIAFVACIKT